MEVLTCLAFWITAICLVVFSLITVFIPKIAYSILFGFLSFIMFALLFFLLNAPFNAAVQIIIYGVTLSILFSFALMLTNKKSENKEYIFISPRLLLSIIGICLIIVSIYGIIKQDMFFGLNEFLNVQPYILPDAQSSIETISQTMFTKFFFAFELVSVLLLTGIVGILVYRNKNEKPIKEERNE